MREKVTLGLKVDGSKSIFAIDPYPKVWAESILKNKFLIGSHQFSVNPIKNLFVGDLLYAGGGLFEKNELRVAFFRLHPVKKTYVFANLMAERYRVMAKHYAEKFDIFLDFTPHHFASWVTLHEAFHNTGPLPLFSAEVNKFCRKGYGFVEELRVELSIMYFILKCVPKSTHDSFKQVIWLILCDRIFRAARFHFNPTHKPKYGMYAKEVEGDTAICLLALLVNQRIINLSENKFELTDSSLTDVIEPVLNKIYNFEAAMQKRETFEAGYQAFSSDLRAAHFSLNHDIVDFLQSSACTNCDYQLRFEVTC